MTVDYLASVGALLDRIDTVEVERVIDRLREARDGRATIYIAGNGGSAAIASHWVNDLGKATKRSGRAPMRVMCLSDNTSWFSALANDEGYERSFAGQIENFATAGDLLIVISASGNSANLVEAARIAKAQGAEVIGLLGFDGGRLKDLVDRRILVETDRGAYELVEDAHAVLCHAITRCLIADRHA